MGYTRTMGRTPDSSVLNLPTAVGTGVGPEPTLERRGRFWLFSSFIFCPCHLPLTLALLASVFGGTAIGVVVREHAWLAGSLITAAWVVGTWYGFRLLRRARNGAACPVPAGGATRANDPSD